MILSEDYGVKADWDSGEEIIYRNGGPLSMELAGTALRLIIF